LQDYHSTQGDYDDERKIPPGQAEQMVESIRDVGKITRLERDFSYGYIDGMYRFNKANFRAKGDFHCYDLVEFLAVKSFDSTDWVVEDMKPYVKPELEDIYNNLKFKTRALQVKEINANSVTCADAEVTEIVPKDKMPPEGVLVGKLSFVRNFFDNLILRFLFT